MSQVTLKEAGAPRTPAVPKEVKESGGEVKLMGFGHRVYKNYDPRAKVIKEMADRVFEVTGRNPLLDIALELEKIALSDEYKEQKIARPRQVYLGADKRDFVPMLKRS